MTVTRGDNKACQVTFPTALGSLQDALLLPCIPTTVPYTTALAKR